MSVCERKESGNWQHTVGKLPVFLWGREWCTCSGLFKELTFSKILLFAEKIEASQQPVSQQLLFRPISCLFNGYKYQKHINKSPFYRCYVSGWYLVDIWLGLGTKTTCVGWGTWSWFGWFTYRVYAKLLTWITQVSHQTANVSHKIFLSGTLSLRPRHTHLQLEGTSFVFLLAS